MYYVIDRSEGYDAASFELFSIAVQGEYGQPPTSWGVYPELTPGFWAFISSAWQPNLSFPTDDPVDGDQYVLWDGAGDMSYFISVGWLDYGDLAYNTPEFPPTGPIEPGDSLNFRFAHRGETTLSTTALVGWLDGSGDLIGSAVEYEFTDDLTSSWQVFKTLNIDDLPGYTNVTIGAGLEAPSGAVAFSLRLDWEGFTFGGGEASYDALRVEVGSREISSLFDTYPTGFRFPYNWRRSE